MERNNGKEQPSGCFFSIFGADSRLSNGSGYPNPLIGAAGGARFDLKA
ncbi:hypothetical protein [Cohnella nanjingensis]|nr:hypothetical protein [Cohnella nanjingensis]